MNLPTSEDTGLGSVVTNKANSAVSAVLQHQSDGATEGRKRKYTHLTPGQRAIFGYHAAECGNASAMKCFKMYFLSVECSELARK